MSKFMKIVKECTAVGVCSVGIIGIGAFGYANLPTRLTVGTTSPTLKYLADGNLRLIEPGKNAELEGKNIWAKDLFLTKSPLLIYVVRRPGCKFCRSEAVRITEDLGEKLKEKNVSVIGVLHETLGAEEFRPFLKSAELYYDPREHFYGPEKHWLPEWMGFLRVSTYLNYLKVKKGIEGNADGDGRLLGGIYLLDKSQIMVFARVEKTWGDQFEMKRLTKAIEKLA